MGSPSGTILGSPPHMRGAVTEMRTALQELGSPPRMRGVESGAIEEGGDVRITPAHAGSRRRC